VPHWPLRPRLAIVVLLALCDYLLWNWSLSANHDTLALVCGMALIPLLIALAWLLVLGAVRLIASAAQLPRTRRTRSSTAARAVRSRPSARGHRAPHSPASRTDLRGRAAGAAVQEQTAPLGDSLSTGGAPPPPPPSKLAA
jgi:hypothetical protein